MDKAALAKWEASFMSFRALSNETLRKPVPAEITELKKESQDLEPMFAVAQDYAADAIGHLLEAKANTMDALKREGWPKSALNDAAEAASFRAMWFKEQAERLAEVVKSRAFKVSAAIKSTEG